MNQRRFHIGPGAASLILIIVTLSMSVLGMLSLMSARSDVSLSERSVDVAEQVYRLNDAAEGSLARLDAVLLSCQKTAPDEAAYLAAVAGALPEGMTLSEGVVTWTETDDVRTLLCAVKLMPLGEKRRCAWVRHELEAHIGEMEMDEAWN